MNARFDPEQTKYYPAIKSKKRGTNGHLVTVNAEGNQYMCLTVPRENVTNETIQQLVLDPLVVESYKRFIHDRILNADDDAFTRKLEAYGYGDCAIYTWILKSDDNDHPTIESATVDTPVRLYMTKVVSSQELGTLHRDLDQLHPREVSHSGPVIGAGELKVVSPTKIEFNVLSGTYMVDKILKKKSKANQEILVGKIITLLTTKLESKGFEVEFNGNKDLVEGTCFVTPKENMNKLRLFFKKPNATRRNKNKTNNAAATRPGAGPAAAGAGAGRP